MEELGRRWPATPVFRDPAAEPVAPAYRVEIPPNLFELTKQDPEAGRQEQLEFRSRLQALLRAGFMVTELLSSATAPASYLLEKSPR